MSDSDDSLSSDDDNTGFVRRYYRDMAEISEAERQQQGSSPFTSTSPLRRPVPLTLRHAPMAASATMSDAALAAQKRKAHYDDDVSKATDALWAWSSSSAPSAASAALPQQSKNKALPPPQFDVSRNSKSTADRDAPPTLATLLRNSVIAAIRQLPSDLCFFHMSMQRWKIDKDKIRSATATTTSSSSSSSSLPPSSVVKRLLTFADEVGQLGNFVGSASALPSVTTMVLSLSDECATNLGGDSGGGDGEVGVSSELDLVTPVSVVHSALGWVATHVLQRVSAWATANTTTSTSTTTAAAATVEHFVQLLHEVDLSLRPAVRTLLGLIDSVREMEFDVVESSASSTASRSHHHDIIDMFVAQCDTALSTSSTINSSTTTTTTTTTTGWIHTSASIIALTSAFVCNLHRSLSNFKSNSNSSSSLYTPPRALLLLAPRTFAQLQEPLLREMPLLRSMLGLGRVEVQARLRAALSLLQRVLTTAEESDLGNRVKTVRGDLVVADQKKGGKSFLLSIDESASLLVRFHAVGMEEGGGGGGIGVKPVCVSDCETTAAWMSSNVASRVVSLELEQLRSAACTLLVSQSAATPAAASPVSASLHLLKQIGLFQAWSTLQELFVDRLLFVSQPGFCAKTGFKTAKQTTLPSPTEFWASGRNLQRWFADVLDSQHVPHEHAVLTLLVASPQQQHDQQQQHAGDASGVSIVRTLSSIRLKLKLHPALQIIAHSSSRHHGAESGESVSLLDVLENVFSTLLTLTFAVRRLQCEFRSSRNQPNRGYWRLLHTCSFALDAVLRFVTTEVEALSNRFQAAALAATGTATASISALEEAFRVFGRGLRGVAVSSSSSSSSGGGGAAAASGDGVARAISSHVATLCAIACDSSRVGLMFPSSASSGTATAARQQQELDRELQRVDITCRSLVAVLRGLRLETHDSVVEKRCSALLATLTFNQFF